MRFRFVLALLLAAGLILAGARSVNAHSTLIEADPPRNDAVVELDEVVLTFGSPLIDDGGAAIALATLDGVDLPIGPTEFLSPLVVRATVPDTPEPGNYVIRYQVLSEDGDLNDGGYSFEIIGASGGAGSWVLLGTGVAGVVVVAFLLRPKAPKSRKTTAEA